MVRIVVALMSLSCQTLYDPMDCSMPDYPAPHYLSEIAQTYIRWFSDAIQPSHPLLSPLPPAFNLSQQQGVFQLFASGGQKIGSSAPASVLPMNTRIDLFQDGLVGSPCSPRDSQESPPTPQFKSINSSGLSLLRDGPTLPCIHDYWKNHSFDYMDLCQQSDVSAFSYAA